MARPTSFKAEYAKQAEKLCQLGATDTELADFFEVAVSTINLWKNKHPQFLKSLKLGKEAADTRVERSLFQLAMGYEGLETKAFKTSDDKIITKTFIKQFPPNVTACIFWLKNRMPEEWRDRVEHTGADGKDLDLGGELNERELARRVAFLLQAGVQHLPSGSRKH